MSSRGHNRERQVKALLASDDWLVVRAAGSLGDADLVALRVTDSGNCRALLIECKSTAQGPYEHFGPADRAELLLAAKIAGAEAWLAHWPPRGKLRWYPSSEWPSLKPRAVRSLVKDDAA